MGDVIGFTPQVSLWASDIGAYANCPEEWCRIYFNRPEDDIHRIRGILHHFRLSKSAQQGHRHINWEKPSNIEQAKSYLPSNSFAYIPALCAALPVFVVPLGIIYGAWSAIYLPYALVIWAAIAFVAKAASGISRKYQTGLLHGKVLAIDNVTLHSSAHNISCRPDRIVQVGKWIIPEEWKSHKQPVIGDIIQLAVQLLAVEEVYNQRPPFGALVMGNGRRYKIKNTSRLRQKLTYTIAEMRETITYLSREFSKAA